MDVFELDHCIMDVFELDHHIMDIYKHIIDVFEDHHSYYRYL